MLPRRNGHVDARGVDPSELHPMTARYIPRNVPPPRQAPVPKPQPRKSSISILDAMDDPHLFGQHFRNAKDWKAWKAFLASLFGLPTTPDQLATFQQCTGRTTPPPNGSNEAHLVIGRRGGKSFILATIAVYLAAFRDWRPYLAVGERATVAVVCPDRKQSRVIMRYIRGLLTASPMLRELITGETQERIDLKQRVTIEVMTASFKSSRGYGLACVLLDESAFLPTDEFSAEPDKEIINALKPGMATFPGSMLLCASSPYARKGALWEAYQRHYGKDDSSVLVWQAPTRVMHPRIPQRIIDEAMEADPASARAEYGAQFRTDVESFVLREAVEACISPRIIERLPNPENSYYGFVDSSGGSIDDMTLAIAHYDYEKGSVIIACLRWYKPPFSPEIVVKEFARVLKSYFLSTVTGDRYAGEWPREQFSKFGITYEPSTKSKSELYTDLLPLINSARVQLLDQPKMISQLLSLERKTRSGGRDTIDHPSGGGHHDDEINAVAGAAVLATSKMVDISMGWVSGPDNRDAEDKARAWRVQQLQQHIAYCSGPRSHGYGW